MVGKKNLTFYVEEKTINYIKDEINSSQKYNTNSEFLLYLLELYKKQNNHENDYNHSIMTKLKNTHSKTELMLQMLSNYLDQQELTQYKHYNDTVTKRSAEDQINYYYRKNKKQEDKQNNIKELTEELNLLDI